MLTSTGRKWSKPIFFRTMAGIAKVCQAATPKSLRWDGKSEKMTLLFYFFLVFVRVTSNTKDVSMTFKCSWRKNHGDSSLGFCNCFPMSVIIIFFLPLLNALYLFCLGLLAAPFGAIFACADRWGCLSLKPGGHDLRSLFCCSKAKPGLPPLPLQCAFRGHPWKTLAFIVLTCNIVIVFGIPYGSIIAMKISIC